MAKLGLLYAQRGFSGARQVLSSGWVTESSKAHVRASSDLWGRYGYLFWARSDASAYCALGAGGQYIVVYEDQGGAVLACTSDSEAASNELLEMIEEYFFGTDDNDDIDPVARTDDDDDTATEVSSAPRRGPSGSGISGGAGELFAPATVPACWASVLMMAMPVALLLLFH